VIHLLQPLQGARKGTGHPLWVEVPVEQETAPYLVTSTQGVLWVPAPVVQVEQEHMARAAVRQGPLNVLYGELVLAVLAAGRAYDWGNTQPMTRLGYQNALEHMASYDITDVDVLCAEGSATLAVQDWGVACQSCVWMPQGHLVVVPQDRSLLGVVCCLPPLNRFACVIHNAARGMVVLSSEDVA
jgi:hypothetical protein